LRDEAKNATRMCHSGPSGEYEEQKVSVRSDPNVVFIGGDNVAWGDIGCYGGLAPTPRIDALAGQGLRFKNYNVEAQCTPTRSAILTGRLPVRTGNCSVAAAGAGSLRAQPAGHRQGSCCVG
jgi:arylsulfatase A-like enzyme